MGGEGDIKHSNTDILKEKMLDCDQGYDFDSGLEQAISWYKENLKFL